MYAQTRDKNQTSIWIKRVYTLPPESWEINPHEYNCSNPEQHHGYSASSIDLLSPSTCLPLVPAHYARPQGLYHRGARRMDHAIMR